MIEAMACGTPVIAFRRGSVPEVIENGLTGFIVDDMAGAIEAAKKIDTIDRAGVRKRFCLTSFQAPCQHDGTMPNPDHA